jgi:large subunit ribosomal protein L23
MAELHDILLRPLVTEKTARAEADNNVYTFEVGINSNKVQIADAVQRLFGVKVESVRTQIVRGKNKRFGKYTGKRSNWKKASVKLAEGDLLNFFEN